VLCASLLPLLSGLVMLRYVLVTVVSVGIVLLHPFASHTFSSGLLYMSDMPGAIEL
jgi:hypothetical protein